ncbi:hypothetical protein ANN_14715 [Periplaneta americana]|uniref:Per a allergen n=1 Tax=Periplaneta americana TaxID=6978 RepID=A0ABQ8SX04_PERAM|nr:hypothetical protein ANN_14715 [Periplaneta americana]
MAGLCEGGNEPTGSLKASNCPKTGLNLISDTNKTSLMKQLSQEIMGWPPAWLSRLRRLPAGLKLRSGAGSIPAWADYLVGFFPRFSPNVSLGISKKPISVLSLTACKNYPRLCEEYGVSNRKLDGYQHVG